MRIMKRYLSLFLPLLVLCTGCQEREEEDPSDLEKMAFFDDEAEEDQAKR